MEKSLDGKNIVLVKFNKLGGKELLDKYINSQNKILNDQILYLKEEFYKKHHDVKL